MLPLDLGRKGLKRMKSVRDSILLFRGEFCHSFPRSVLRQKERIISKAILAARRKIYRSFTIPLANKHVSVSVHKRHGRVKARRTIFPWHILELFEQLGVVFGIISVLSGITGRIDPRSAMQRIDTQSRVIRNGRKKRRFIERRLREEFGFTGTPIQIGVRVREKRQRR